MSVLVIAEPGATHEGRYEDMVRLIHAAHEAGADVFKPQWVSDAARMCERRHIGVDHPKRAYYEQAYRWNSYPLAWHEDFSRLVRQCRMQYAATSFLPEDVAQVDPYVTMHKIASFEADDGELVCRAWDTSKRVCISTGLGTGRYVLQNTVGASWLHCVSAYPAPLSQMNLAVLHGMPRPGLSDHSRHVLTGAVAVGAGAQIIEAHLRLDDTSPENPDYAAAFTPAEFATYVQNIRTAEIMMGSGEKQIQPCEQDMLPYRVTTP